MFADLLLHSAPVSQRNLFEVYRGFFAILPAILIVFSMSCAFVYTEALSISVQAVRRVFLVEEGRIPADSVLAPGMIPMLITTPRVETFSGVLKNEEYDEIPMAPQLMVSYLLLFLFAEAAFILMAIREYLEDVIGFTEMELISGKPKDLHAKENQTERGV
jgi:hypothetical protein